MTDINSRRSIIAIVYLAVVGPCVFILQPGFVQGLVVYMGFSEQQAGLIASYEMFGIAATTVLLSFVSSRVPWRSFLYVCLAICVVGNLASIGRGDFTSLAVLRFLTGLGSGGLVSLTFTMMGLTERADRNFGYIIVWVLTYGAFGLLLMPSAFTLTGMNGLLAFFALFCASGLWFVRDLPNSGAAGQAAGDAAGYSGMLKIVSLAALLVYNTAIGIVWAYLFLVGLEAGMAEQAVANALTISQFLGIAGAFTAIVLELRFGRILPLAVGVLGVAASIYLLLGESGPGLFWAAVCGFNFLWNLAMPYLLATMADFDLRGRMVVHGVSMQFVGFAIGPFIGAQLVGVGGYDLVNGTAVVMFVIAIALLVPGLLAQRRVLRGEP
jgi:MFS family permease